MLVAVLPEHGRLALAVVRVEGHGVMRRVHVIAVRPGAHRHVDLLALEQHWGAAVLEIRSLMD